MTDLINRENLIDLGLFLEENPDDPYLFQILDSGLYTYYDALFIKPDEMELDLLEQFVYDYGENIPNHRQKFIKT